MRMRMVWEYRRLSSFLFRDELLEVDFLDFIELENDAIEQAEIMRVYNNETLENYQTTFNDLKTEDNEFKANMTERLILILEAQGLIQEGDEGRKKRDTDEEEEGWR